jgi:hypothetical protein
LKNVSVEVHAQCVDPIVAFLEIQVHLRSLFIWPTKYHSIVLCSKRSSFQQHFMEIDRFRCSFKRSILEHLIVIAIYQ